MFNNHQAGNQNATTKTDWTDIFTKPKQDGEEISAMDLGSLFNSSEGGSTGGKTDWSHLFSNSGEMSSLIENSGFSGVPILTKTDISVQHKASTGKIPKELGEIWYDNLKHNKIPEIPAVCPKDQEFIDIAKAYQTVFDYKNYVSPKGVCENFAIFNYHYIPQMLDLKYYKVGFAACWKDDPQTDNEKIFDHRATVIYDENNNVVAILDPFTSGPMGNDQPVIWDKMKWWKRMRRWHYEPHQIEFYLPDFFEQNYLNYPIP